MSTSDPAPNRGPRHVGIILDGNRRWARERGKPALLGTKPASTRSSRSSRPRSKPGSRL